MNFTLNTIKNFLIPLIVLFTSISYATQTEFNQQQSLHPFGILATSAFLDELEKTLPGSPPVSRTGKSLVTFNNQGFDVLDANTAQDSFLIQAILKFSKTAKLPILEIGGGYGRLSKLMLEEGATVIENDLDYRHLVYGRKLVSKSLRERLYLNTYKFPQDMTFKANSLSGVVMHRVLHMMPPSEIDEGLAKVNLWLIPGGKVFIAVLPPQHIDFKDKVLSIYEQRWNEGHPWPGSGFKSADLLPKQSYALPETLHVMDERPLKKALEKHGFKIQEYRFISMKKFHDNAAQDSQELFGLIAVKL